MRRRDFIAWLGAAASTFARPAGVRAQAGKTYRIGILETVTAERNSPNMAGLRQGLREHGYIEGQNLQIEYRTADGRAEYSNVQYDINFKG